MNYGELLKDIRKDKELKQIDIANVLNISRSTYKDYESEATIIPIKHLVSLADYFNVSLDYLFGFAKKENYAKMIIGVDNIKSGLRLKEFRKDNKLTQVELASFLHTTFSTIGWYEKGRNLIATPFLYTICKEYKISADYLLGKIDKKVRLK